jgi:hypothetical protein
VIPIKIQPAPVDFEAKVKEPGEAFLAKNPKPNSRDWSRHSYWRRSIEDLYRSYNCICAYSCHWIPPDTGAKTVEHFKPKGKYPAEAFHWENYRLVCSTLNGRKSDYEDVLDPFTLEEGWFILDFPSLLVHPSDALSKNDTQRVRTTIKRLGLNDEGTCLQARVSWVESYIQMPLPFPYLEQNAPFIAYELKRQGLIEEIRTMMDYEPGLLLD